MSRYISLLAAAMLPLFLSAEDGAASHLAFVDGNTVDLGAFDRGETQTGAVRYVNDGTEPLSIVSLFSECGCTVADYDRKPLAPGDTATMTVRFDPKDRPTGRFSKLVRVRTDSGQTEVVIVKGCINRQYRR